MMENEVEIEELNPVCVIYGQCRALFPSFQVLTVIVQHLFSLPYSNWFCLLRANELGSFLYLLQFFVQTFSLQFPTVSFICM